MTKSRFSEAQMVGILKEVEFGAKVAETCRKHGISDADVLQVESQFSVMTVSHLSQLRQLQDDNAKLKRMTTWPTIANSVTTVTSGHKLWKLCCAT